jgi:CheY-like chemotaxis protein
MERKALQTILYVDDEPDIRQIVQIALGLTQDLQVHIGESGEQALVLARELKPDLVLLDVMMPGLDGPATMIRMSKDPLLARIPVIFMTAKAMPKEVARFRQMGAAGVIAKPFDPMQLLKQVFYLWDAFPQAPQSTTQPSEEARLREQFTQLREKFLQRTSGELPLLQALLERLHHGDSTVLEQLEKSVHKIHGGGATFGFAAVSESARAFEHLVEELMEGGTSVATALGPLALGRLTQCSQRLAHEIEAAARS